MQITFSVEAKSQSTNRLFLRRVKSKSRAFRRCQSDAIGEKEEFFLLKRRALLAVLPGKDLAIWPIPTSEKNVYRLLKMELIVPP
jgi:hypothetical protein